MRLNTHKHYKMVNKLMNKKAILAVAAVAMVSGTVLTSCSTSSEKLEDAKENVVKANKELDNANEEYLADVENYKKEITAKINGNKKSIAEFDERIAKEKKEVKADYKKKMAELRKQNSDLKKKMDDYKIEGKEKWESFKNEFNHDMDELGKAVKDLVVDNKE